MIRTRHLLPTLLALSIGATTLAAAAPASAAARPTITSVSPNRLPKTAGDLILTLTGTGLADINGVEIQQRYPSDGTVLSTSPDGTSARVKIPPPATAFDWETVPSRIDVFSPTACTNGGELCRNEDIPGDDLVFYEPTGQVPGFPVAPTAPVVTREGADVRVTWNPSATPNVRYKLFVDGAPRYATPGLFFTEPEALLADLDATKAHVFQVRAMDEAGNASLRSPLTRLAGSEADTQPAPAPIAFSVSRNAFSMTTDVCNTHAAVSWADDPGAGAGTTHASLDVVGYELFQNGVKVRDVVQDSSGAFGGNEFFSELDPAQSYAFKLRNVDAAGNLSAFSPEITLAPIPVTAACPKVLDFTATGSAALKSLVKGSVPLSGTLKGKTTGEVAGAGQFTADLTLGQATANLTALGILPARATLQFVQTAPVTGTITATAMTAVAKMRIKLAKVSVLGIELLGGANCQAKQISSITLRSINGYTPAGTNLSGTFAISDLSGCGALTNIVSPLTASTSNTIALSLKAAPSA